MAIPLSCTCGKTFRVRDDLAGKKVRCPECSEVLVVPAAVEEVTADPPPLPPRKAKAAAPQRRRPHEDEEEEDDREDRRPRRHRKQSNATLYWIIGGVGAGVLLIAGIVTLVLVLKKDRPSDPTNSSNSGGDTKPEATFGSVAQRAKSQNNLKEIALGLLNYHEAHQSLPPAFLHDPAARRLLSWRVAILPEIEQGNLYRQIHLNEPWDSHYNRQFWDKMPKVYQLPGKEGDGTKTYYELFVGPGTPIGQAQGARLTNFRKGTSNTILVVEAATPVNWMEPKDIEFKPSPNGFPPNQLGGHFGEYANAVLADGSVHRLSWKLSPQALQGAICTTDPKVPSDDPAWNQ